MTMWILLVTILVFPKTTAFSVGSFPQRDHGVRLVLRAMDESSKWQTDRRRFLAGGAAFWAACSNVAPTEARGLITFPCTTPLGNRYHFMRAGESLLEADDIWSTNPLFLTNREAALSDRGVEQVEATCRLLKEDGINPTLVRYSLASSATDTASLVGKELGIGRDRLVPEFNFMDPRAVGKWDMLPLSATEAAIWAMDADEAGPDGKGALPPANEDSTPHETLGDQVVRLRQLISVLETQFSGETILLIFPDGTGPALLSAMIAGIPLNKVHQLEFHQAEVRFDVSMESTLALLEEKKNEAEEYATTLARGRNELRKLRETSPENVVSVRDQQLEQERVELEKEQEQRTRERKEKEEAVRSAQRERAKETEAVRQKRRDEIAAARRQQRYQRRSDVESEDTTEVQDFSGTSPVSVMLGSAAVLALGGLALTKDADDPIVEEKTGNIQPQSSNSSDSVVATPEIEVGEHGSDGILSVPDNAESPALAPIGKSKDEQEQPRGGEPDVSTERLSNTEPFVQKPNDVSKETLGERVVTPAKEDLEYDDGGESWLQVLSEIIAEDDIEDG